ncbi:hypothetical protein IT570_13905 [Candidatus Sumerlaeota bacterium]|nr:hypothetical protein [Candidatus Sumerlaeota bacterium]
MRLIAAIATLLIASVIARAPAQDVAIVPFREFKDLPTTPTLILKFKPGSEDRITAITPEGISAQMRRGKALHAQGMEAYLNMMKALKERDPALAPMEAFGYGDGGGRPGLLRDEHRRNLKRYRLSRPNEPEFWARVNGDGIVEQITVNLNTNSYDVRHQFVFHTQSGKCRILAVATQSADGLTSVWFFHPDQSLLGVIRCDAAGMLNGPLLEWDDDGNLTQALNGTANYEYVNPFMR